MTAAILTLCGMAVSPGQVVPSAIAPPDATMPTPVVAAPDTPAAKPPQDPNQPILLTSRTAILDIDTDPATRKTIQRILLYVSRDQGQTWGLEASATPDQESFTFTAKEDGVYWCTIQTVFQNGIKTPTDVTRHPADRRLFLDGSAPTVRIKQAKRVGEEVELEWLIDEKFPNDAATVVRYRAGDQPNAPWVAAPVTPSKRSTTFKPMVNGPLAIEVVAADMVGNTSTAKADVGVVATASATTSTTSGPPVKPIPLGETASMPTTLPAPTTPGAGPTTLPDIATPKPHVPNLEPVPVAVSSTDTANSIATKVIRLTRFELAYSVTAGPAGVSAIDLWVTRDDGKTWRKWSRHDGRETPLKVVLDTKDNPQVEGLYGFKIVPESGSRFSEPAPVPGTAPEFRVLVDVTAPSVQIFEPAPHADRPDAIVIRWKATDANFGKEPITIEYAEQLNGTWKAVNASDLVPVVSGEPATAPRLANTGEYGWRLPGDLTSPRVYLKFSATDTAGNKTEAVTRDPILVDLTKPRARIQGIVGLSEGK